jgi:hypothetical protein
MSNLHNLLTELLNNYSYTTILTELNASVMEMRDHYNKSYDEMLQIQTPLKEEELRQDIKLLSKSIDITASQLRQQSKPVIVEKAVQEDCVAFSTTTIKKRNNKKKQSTVTV